MFKTIKAVLNNLNEGPYLKNKNSLNLYDMSANNKIFLDKDSAEMNKLSGLEEKNRRNNLKIFGKNMAKIRGLQVVLFGVPALLCAATICSFSLKETTKTKEFNTYKKNVIEFDEEHIYQDDMEDTIYLYEPLIKSFIDENIDIIYKKHGNAIIYFW